MYLRHVMSCLMDSPSSRGGVLALDMSLRPSCLQLRDISCWRWITWTFLFEDFQCLLVRGLTGQGAETLWTTVGVLFFCVFYVSRRCVVVWTSGQGEGQRRWWTLTAHRDCSMAGQPTLRMSPGADYKEPRGHLSQLSLCFVALFLQLGSLPKH